MKNYLFYWVFIFIVSVAYDVSAHVPPGFKKDPPTQKELELRELCAPATAKVELTINNVRALLLNGGDVWWDRSDGRYIVPNVTVKPVSSIFAAAVWIVGYNGDQLKGAGRMYGGNSNKHDWFPGPLNDLTGQITVQECSNWDRFFEVRGQEIDKHIAQFNEFLEAGTDYPESLIPLNVRGWPARGNPYFKSIYNWSLPSTTAALAPFYDYDGDGEYDPAKGDFPIIEVRGVGGACEPTADNPVPPTYADQMYFWIYNDNGNVHTEFNGTPINMEVQVQAYAFKTNDQLNDMTFMRYKLVNRSPTVTDRCIFGWWVDSDLGCPDDDLIGCDSSLSLVYYYNVDGTDGNSGPDMTLCNAGGGSVNTYGRKVPILGIDYFEGPTIDTIIEGKETNYDIGMTSFTYWNRESAEPGTTDPKNLQQLYNYLDAKWKDGTPFTFGGSGYKSGGPVTRYPFPDAPDNVNGWSMKTVTALPGVDRRTAQSTGPITLQSNKTNYLVVGVPWVPDQDYSGPNNAPSLTDLIAADRICQGLFDNCFKIFDGPDAPNVDIIELDKKLVLALSNDPETSNNFDLNYHGFSPGISVSKDTFGLFKFQGYMIYQVKSPDVSPADLDDPSKSRLFAQVDLKDSVTTLFNWTPIVNPSYPDPKDPLHHIWIPTTMVNGENKGLRNTFEVNRDLFATGDDRLVNHKKYYYTAVAYAYNNYKTLDVKGDGQRITFALGRRNSQIYTAIPRPIIDRKLNSDYGSGAIITRLDGEGTYKSFLELADGERDRLFNLSFISGPSAERTILYKEGNGPVAVKVYNPIDVIDGVLNVAFNDKNPTDSKLDINSAVWNLTNATGDTLVKEEKFAKFNERLIAEYGISIFFPNNDPGEDLDDVNGYVGQERVYADPTKDNWLTMLRDGGEVLSDNPNISLILSEALNWINFVEKFSDKGNQDPKNVYEKLGFWPLALALKEPADVGAGEFLTPVPASSNIKNTVEKSNTLADLNNVDIVFTSDRSKWSKCIVVEASNAIYSNAGLPPEGNAPQFSLRKARSVTKDVDANGNPVLNSNPDSTGLSWFPGYAIDVETGMRLNIFFSENSSFDPAIFGGILEEVGENPNIGRDMLFNPGANWAIPFSNNFQSPDNFFAGGQHYIYVSKTKYDECLAFQKNLKGQNPNDINKARVLAQITWVGVPLGTKMLSYKDGLIPQETVYKLRVNNSYKVPATSDGISGLNNGMPMYKIEIKDKAFAPRSNDLVNRALDSISVVPNPYYAYSAYENTEVANIVKITNLPPKCVVTIYSLDGKFVRQFNRNEVREERKGEGRGVRYGQVTPDIEWDLKNGSGITVGSGIYLIHVKSDEGERVIKWVGTIRQLEISGF
ncbi:MAG: hypothetical protein KBF75_01405 [Saprospiraceae bacterium]|nr:hypothetical protein [Saprospiraceae bacterium]